MKKLVSLFMVFTVLISCKEDKKTDVDTIQNDKTNVAIDGKTLKQSDGLIAIQGEFLYSKSDNAAVLKTSTQMYGIIIDDQMMDLQKTIESYKIDEYTMVPVTIRGRIIKNEEATDEWKSKIEIKEILKVSAPNPDANDVIKIGNK